MILTPNLWITRFLLDVLKETPTCDLQERFPWKQQKRTLCVLETKPTISGLLTTHVDALCWAVKPQHELAMDQVVEVSVVRTISLLWQ